MGLRTYIVGEAAAEAFERLSTHPELDVARLADTDTVLREVDGSEPAIVLLPLGDVEKELVTIATLVSNGAQIVVLAAGESANFRSAAFSAGVSDIAFPPYAAWYIEETVLALAGNPLRKDVRVPTQMEALLVPVGGAALSGHLVSLSMGELRARVSGALPPGAILRVALKPPRPHRLPVLFARARSAEPLDDGRLEIHARFVGMTAEEQHLLGSFLEQQPAEVSDVAGVLVAIEALDTDTLRRSLGGHPGRGTPAPPDPLSGSIGGIPLPALTAPELAWLRAAPGTADAALADVAVARCRAELIAAVLEAVGADLLALAGLPMDRYREELESAKRAVTAAMELFRRDAALSRNLSALSRRIDIAAKTLARIATEIDDATMPNLSSIIPIDRSAKPPAEKPPVGKTNGVVPADGTARPPTDPDAEDLVLNLDEGAAVDELAAADQTQRSVPGRPASARPLAAAAVAAAAVAAVPADVDDDFANAKTNPQITAIEGTPPAMLNPDLLPDAPSPAPAPAPTPAPSRGAAAPIGVAVTRSGKRLRNPFLED